MVMAMMVWVIFPVLHFISGKQRKLSKLHIFINLKLLAKILVIPVGGVIFIQNVSSSLLLFLNIFALRTNATLCFKS
jgi:hypothetical protein